MKAIILCAGFGKRMKPYTDTYQKTMIPVHGKPLLEYLIDGITYSGINEFIIVVGYRKEQIIDYFQDGKTKGIKIEYIEQIELNGTGGALLLCEEKIEDQHFFLTWGDILVPFKIYKKVVDTFRKEKPEYILVTNYLDNLQKGCEIFCEGDYCTKMVEKPPKEMQTSNLNNCGIFVLSKDIFKTLKEIIPSKRGEIELPDAISKGINEKKWKVRIIKMEKDEFRGDFGDLSEYERLNNEKEWLNLLKK